MITTSQGLECLHFTLVMALTYLDLSHVNYILYDVSSLQ